MASPVDISPINSELPFNMLFTNSGHEKRKAMSAASGWYGSLFVQNEKIEEMVCSGMMIFTSAFFFAGINGITSFYFTATGRARNEKGVLME